MRPILLVLILLLVPAMSLAADTVKSLDDLDIAYDVLGEGDTAVVLIHCWSCDRTYWREQLDALAAKYLVVNIDLAGHGESSLGRNNYLMADFGSDVAAVVKKLDLKQVILVGHSMGGTVAVEAAAQLPGRVIGLIGIDTLQEPGFNYPAQAVEGFLEPMRADFKTRTGQFVASMFPEGADQALIDQVAGDMSDAPPEVAISAMYYLLTHDLKATLETLDVRIACLDSDKAPIDREGWAFYEPGYATMTMEGVGHFLLLEKPAEFNSNFLAMIKSLEKYAGVR